jgi:hypothetical protein
VHEPGPDDHDVDARRGERVAEALGEGVEAGLCRAVGVVRLPGALGGDGGEDDDRAAPLRAHPLGEDREQADGADEVRAGERRRSARVALGSVLVAEDAERDERDVDGPEQLERLRDRPLVLCGIVVGVEADHVDVEAAAAQRGGGRRAVGVAHGEDDAAQALGRERLNGRDRDVGVPAEDGGGLDRVVHGRARERRRPESKPVDAASMRSWLCKASTVSAMFVRRQLFRDTLPRSGGPPDDAPNSLGRSRTSRSRPVTSDAERPFCGARGAEVARAAPRWLGRPRRVSHALGSLRERLSGVLSADDGAVRAPEPPCRPQNSLEAAEQRPKHASGPGRT